MNKQYKWITYKDDRLPEGTNSIMTYSYKSHKGFLALLQLVLDGTSIHNNDTIAIHAQFIDEDEPFIKIIRKDEIPS